VLLACFVGQTLAAPSDWAVVQNLPAGQRVQVNLRTGKILHGNVDHVTAEAVYLKTHKQMTPVRRDEISELSIPKKTNWTKPVLIGALAGAAAAGIAAPRTLEHESGYGGAVAGMVVFGAVIGAGVGYLATGSGSSLVYKSPGRR
jgi:hypothetical protein